MDLLYPCCAALDVHKASIVACVRHWLLGDPDHHEVRSFGTTTGELERLRDWLLACGVAVVAMESTGVYWKPVYNVLETHLRLLLVNAERYKQVEGRKTDRADCRWLATLLQHGLLQASFVPPGVVRQLRDLTRQRTKLTQQRAGVVNRIHKVLEDANIKLGDVASDVLGKSGRRMLEALIGGEQDPAKLAELALGRLRDKIPQLREALRGLVTEHHRFLLQLHLDQLDGLDRLIDRLGERILAVVDPEPQPPGPAEGAGGHDVAGAATTAAAAGATPAATATTADASAAGGVAAAGTSTPPGGVSLAEGLRLLQTIPGIKGRTAEVVLAEIGPDMGVFATPGQLASWAGLCPGNQQSAGKRYSGRMRRGDRWLKHALTQAAWAVSRTRGCWLQGRYKKWVSRLGKKRAVLAVAHRLLELCHLVLSRRTPYREPPVKQAA
jgi:transposase